VADTLPITRHSGTLRNVTIDGHDGLQGCDTYSVSHLYCDCADATIALAPRQADTKDAISVKIHCPTHGTLNTVAIKCGVTLACETPASNLIFAWAIKQHDRDKRIAWGMKLRGGNKA
jgi:hypothetical protein